MSEQRITLEFLGVPSDRAGLLESFFSTISSTIAEIWEFEIKPENVFCFPNYYSDSKHQGAARRIFIRYGSTSSGQLALDWKSHVHSRIAKLIQEKFQADSVEKIE